jgi:hypothetical protein
LKFDIFAVGGDSFESEINSNGGHVVLIELVVGESKQQAALSY